MPIHVQTPEGKVLTWAEKEDIKMREHMRQAPIRTFEETHDALMKRFSEFPVTHTQTVINLPLSKSALVAWRAMAAVNPEFLPKFGYIDNTDPYKETERGEE